MIRLPHMTPRQWLIVIHDLLVTAVAVFATFFVRFEDSLLEQRLHWIPVWLPLFVAYAGLVYFFFRMHEAKWRFVSMPELVTILRASTVLAISLLVLDYILLSPTCSARSILAA